VAAIRESFWWHFGYMSNWYFVFHGVRPDEPTFHFWSLAVEEQFYLIWPWVILFLPRKWLAPVVQLFIVAAVLSRFVMVREDYFWLAVVWATPSCFDTLGIGALLAVLTRHPDLGPDRNRFLRTALFIGLPVALFLLVQNWQAWDTPSMLTVVFFHLGLALSYVWLVGRAATGFTGLAGKFLEFAPLVYLGRISYGTYVFHNFLPYALEQYWEMLEWTGPLATLARFLLLTACTVALASMSWYCFEKPINNLKRYFPYG
jgi:peptidoglycan/LPS O-acetylase OafA/YrhL